MSSKGGMDIKAGRENWTCEMFVGNLYEITKIKAVGYQERIDKTTKELAEKKAAFKNAKLNPITRLIRWINHREQFAIERIERSLDFDEEQRDVWIEWRDFLSAMEKDDKLSLNHDDFTTFFPGDSYSFVWEMLENPPKGEGEGS